MIMKVSEGCSFVRNERVNGRMHSFEYLHSPPDNIRPRPRGPLKQLLRSTLANAIRATDEHHDQPLELLPLGVGLADGVYLDHFRISVVDELFQNGHWAVLPRSRGWMRCGSSIRIKFALGFVPALAEVDSEGV